MSEWKKIKLGEVALSIQTGPFGSQLHQSDYSDDGTPVVMPKDIANGKINCDSIAHVDEEHTQRLSRYKLHIGDIVYPRRGDVAKCAFVTDKEQNWLCGTGCLKIEINNEKAFPKFIFFQLQQPTTTGWIEKHTVGATMPNLNSKILLEVPILLPSLPIQHRIADILSRYDALIDNYRRQIRLLEEAAQRLYRHWFVDLQFPGHENTRIVDGVPEGWERKMVKDFIEFEIGGGWGEDSQTATSAKPAYVIRGTDFENVKNGCFSSFPHRYHTISNLATRTLGDGDIIFEVSGGSKNTGTAKSCLITQDFLDIFNDPMICASFCKRIKPLRRNFSQYLFDTFQYMRFNGITTKYDKSSASNIINYRWKDFLVQEEILLPADSILISYNQIAEKMYKNIISNSIQINYLVEARDRLLPKLMSGEIAV